MACITATELKNHLGHYLHEAYREPVVISKTGRPSVVMLAYEDYQKMGYAEHKNITQESGAPNVKALSKIKSLRDFANVVHVNIQGFKFNRDEANER